MWWDRKRMDVSSFHAGRLTPEHVYFSKSAYAELATPFLPEGEPYNRLLFEKQRMNAILEKGKFFCQECLKKIRHGK
jgi:hypothetical protein